MFILYDVVCDVVKKHRKNQPFARMGPHPRYSIPGRGYMDDKLKMISFGRGCIWLKKWCSHQKIEYDDGWWLLCLVFEGSLEVKLPIIWIDAAWVVGAVGEEKESEEKESEERISKCAKGRKVAKYLFFFQCSGAFLAVDTIKKCTRLWREAHVRVKMV